MQTESQRLSYQIVQLRGPGFTPQLSERRSVLRALEKPATGSCNCVVRIHSSTVREKKRSSRSGEVCNWIVQLRGPGFTPQLSERKSAHRLLEKPATGIQTEREKKEKKNCDSEFTPRVSFGEKRQRYESSSNTRGEKRGRLGR
jgi:hypothetical protein